ncbi:MAG TPA: DUF1615 family protein [Rhodoblastus sp.]|nr:DUF1615 family protein [Rhodoblastus sp.]
MTALVVGAPVTQTSAQSFSPPDVARLILNERGGVRDAVGWGDDILAALADNKFPQTRENICSVIAVASQESGFNENPAVPNLGAIADKAVREKLGKIPILGARAYDMLDSLPDTRHSFIKRVRAARTERDLDLAYRALVEYGAGKSSLDGLLQWGLLDTWVEEYNQISTVGSMQVSVAFALNAERGEHWRPITHGESNGVRDRLYTRAGGLFYGAKQLLGYESGYDQKIYRFADYNSGRYSARNAAFQAIVAKLSGHKVATDGDLLSYDKLGRVKGDVTDSETALRGLIAHYNLGIDDAALRRDLTLEKKKDFTTTQTWAAVRALYARVTGKQPVFAQVPGIQLKSVKIRSKMTTANFADSVNRRYGKCMALALQMQNRPVLMAPKSFWPD